MTHFDEPMDRTIDEVARAMTAAPAPALGARVVARLRPRPSGRRSWLAPAAALLATASVALLVVIRSRPLAVRPPAVASSAAIQNSAALVPPQAHGPEAPRAAKPRVGAGAKAPFHAEAVVDRGVSELPAIDALAIVPIQPTALIISQLTVKPIDEMAPLAVMPIDRVDRNR